MKRYLFIFAVVALMFFSCSNDDELKNTCAVGDPVTELDWLVAEIELLEQSDISQFFYVSQATYENQTVFIFGNCCPNCNTVIPARDCSGEIIGIVGSGDDQIDDSILSRDVIIWQPDDFQCSQ